MTNFTTLLTNNIVKQNKRPLHTPSMLRSSVPLRLEFRCLFEFCNGLNKLFLVLIALLGIFGGASCSNIKNKMNLLLQESNYEATHANSQIKRRESTIICAICKEEISSHDTTTEYIILPCHATHMFHSCCIKPWVASSVQSRMAPRSPIYTTSIINPETLSHLDVDVSPIFLAVYENNLAIIAQLIAAGFNIDAKDKDDMGYTPLMVAVTNNQMEVAQLLVEQGANINALNSAYGTALGIALDNEHTEMIRFLLDHRASLHYTEKFKICQLSNHVLNLLKQHGGDTRCYHCAGKSMFKVALPLILLCGMSNMLSDGVGCAMENLSLGGYSSHLLVPDSTYWESIRGCPQWSTSKYIANSWPISSAADIDQLAVAAYNDDYDTVASSLAELPFIDPTRKGKYDLEKEPAPLFWLPCVYKYDAKMCHLFIDQLQRKDNQPALAYVEKHNDKRIKSIEQQMNRIRKRNKQEAALLIKLGTHNTQIA